MKNIVIVSVLTLLLGTLIGYGVAHSPQAVTEMVATESTTPSPHSDMPAGMEGHTHSHEVFNVPEEQAPQLDLRVEKDEKSGWNVEIITESFFFTPKNINKENIIGEGHAHLYVDGEKVARLYGPYFHYDQEFTGTKTFRVTLNANNHDEYAVADEIIAVEKEVSTFTEPQK